MDIQQMFRNAVRTFNKHILNRLTIKSARSAYGPFAIIYHVGRRSGKTYETPIIVQPSGDGFVLALTYGTNVDWYKNIQTVGECKILWHKKEYAIHHIAPLDAQAGLNAFGMPKKLILGTLGIRDFVTMTA